jgi:EAL domain-containing protein (putative c-di-GMP-specific phosphodiesterase class I)/GGDEF domain-containing protein
VSDKIKEALDYVIDNKKIKTVFQPIISLRDGSVYGHEALSRITCESEIKNPDMLFNAAVKYNCLWQLELLCRTKALEAAFIFMIPPYSKKLFINVNPCIMHDETFKRGFTKDFLKQYNIDPKSIIFEITEKNVITDISSFKSTISYYKNQDYSIAIDDAGSGYSGLNLISDVNPHFIKLDMNLIRGISKDRLKFSLVKGMVEFSKASNISIIAEGIETYDELETIINLGVQYGQGYYFQKPEENIRDIDQSVLKSIIEINSRKNHISNGFTSNIYIKNLAKASYVVTPDERVSIVYENIIRNNDCQGLCVVDNDKPIGIVTKEKIALKLSGNYGYSLYKNKCISDIMDTEFLNVEHDTPINVVSNSAMERTNDKLYDLIVVTENNKFIGTVTIKDLLQKTTELEVSAAKHQNPLSGLPGNIIIEQTLNQVLLNFSEYSVAYLDIDNFKAYNDVYGFEKGDRVIKLLSDTLRKYSDDFHFIGHVGGDDFVIIVDKCVCSDYFSYIKNEFERNVLDFYSSNDVERGYIITANRRGEIEKFPLITLTCVVLNNDAYNFTDIVDLTEKLAGLKKRAKQQLKLIS